MSSKIAQEEFPIMETVTQYIRADKVLDLTTPDGQSVRMGLGEYIRGKWAKGKSNSKWHNAQISISVSDKPQFAYKIKLALLSWVDKVTKKQMDEEAEARFRYARIGLDDNDFPKWDAHITFPKSELRDQVTVDMDAGVGGLEINITGYDTLVGGGQVFIAMDGRHPKIYVWSDRSREDPTSIISLNKAYAGVDLVDELDNTEIKEIHED